MERYEEPVAMHIVESKFLCDNRQPTSMWQNVHESSSFLLEAKPQKGG